MPKVYSMNLNSSGHHHILKENGKIVAVVGVYKQAFQIGEIILKTGFIGSVSVSEQCRGKGYMRLLMEKAEEDMRKEGLSLAMLGGKRNRYGFFGFEIGGIYTEYDYVEENIRHTIGAESGPIVKLIPVNDASDPCIDSMYELYKKECMTCRSREYFYLSCITWEYYVFQIKINDKFAGYLISSEDCSYIAELELNDWDDFLYVARECMSKVKQKKLIIRTQLWETEKSDVLQSTCELYRCIPNLSYKILDYPKALTAMLVLKQSYQHLSDGKFNFHVTGIGLVKIEIHQGTVHVIMVNENSSEFDPEQIDITLTEREVISALMSPVSSLFE